MKDRTMADHRSEGATNALQATPSLTALALWVGGKDINFWVGVGGLFFILLQCAYLLWKWRRDLRHDRERQQVYGSLPE